jgi:hypothetical protein
MQTVARRLILTPCRIVLIASLLGVGVQPVQAQMLRVRGTLALPLRTAVAAAGTVAYTAASNHFAVVDVSNPDSPSLMGQTSPTAASINAIAVAGSYVYCAAAGNGLITIRVSNPAAPAWVSTLALGSVATGVAARDTLVAVSTIAGIKLVGTRNPVTPHVLSGYDAVARWVAWGSSSTRLHVGTDAGVVLLEIHRTIAGGDTTLSLQRITDYGTGRWSPTATAAPYADAVNTSTLIALRESDYGFAGQYAATAAILAICGGPNLSFIGLANGAVQYLDQRANTPSFVAAISLSGAPAGLALAQSGSQPLIVAAQTQGLTVLSYSPLDAPEHHAIELPKDLSVTAFPNPFNATVELQLAVAQPGTYTLDIFDALGRRVLEKSLHIQSSSVERVDFSSCASGIYWARVHNAHATATAKLLYLP